MKSVMNSLLSVVIDISVHILTCLSQSERYVCRILSFPLHLYYNTRHVPKTGQCKKFLKFFVYFLEFLLLNQEKYFYFYSFYGIYGKKYSRGHRKISTGMFYCILTLLCLPLHWHFSVSGKPLRILQKRLTCRAGNRNLTVGSAHDYISVH